jgi:hypothetical protein
MNMNSKKGTFLQNIRKIERSILKVGVSATVAASIFTNGPVFLSPPPAAVAQGLMQQVYICNYIENMYMNVYLYIYMNVDVYVCI